MVLALQKSSTNTNKGWYFPTFALNPNHAVSLSNKLRANLRPAKSSGRNLRKSFDATLHYLLALRKCQLWVFSLDTSSERDAPISTLECSQFFTLALLLVKQNFQRPQSHHKSNNQRYKEPRLDNSVRYETEPPGLKRRQLRHSFGVCDTKEMFTSTCSTRTVSAETSLRG